MNQPLTNPQALKINNAEEICNAIMEKAINGRIDTEELNKIIFPDGLEDLNVEAMIEYLRNEDYVIFDSEDDYNSRAEEDWKASIEYLRMEERIKGLEERMERTLERLDKLGD